MIQKLILLALSVVPVMPVTAFAKDGQMSREREFINRREVERAHVRDLERYRAFQKREEEIQLQRARESWKERWERLPVRPNREHGAFMIEARKRF